MTSQLFIVKNMYTFPGETIHIMPKWDVHLHGHRNKVVPLIKPSILALSFIVAPTSQLMTFKLATVFCVMSITTTSIMKTWSFQIM
jgi:hypothetical protein